MVDYLLLEWMSRRIHQRCVTCIAGSPNEYIHTSPDHDVEIDKHTSSV